VLCWLFHPSGLVGRNLWWGCRMTGGRRADGRSRISVNQRSCRGDSRRSRMAASWFARATLLLRCSAAACNSIGSAQRTAQLVRVLLMPRLLVAYVIPRHLVEEAAANHRALGDDDETCTSNHGGSTPHSDGRVCVAGCDDNCQFDISCDFSCGEAASTTCPPRPFLSANSS
jgi:hypothetical protein